nr:MAG: hypothetical protein DIU57_17655 [Pseudomonadota bacterium]
MTKEREPPTPLSNVSAKRVADHRQPVERNASTESSRSRYAADLLFNASEEELNAIVRLPQPTGVGRPVVLWDRDWIERHLRCAQMCLEEAQLTSFSPSTRAAPQSMRRFTARSLLQK